MAFLIGFFWLLFAIIGVQSFKSSFRRTCVWFEDLNNVRQNLGHPNNYTLNIAPDNIQFCGGYLNATTGLAWPWLKSDLSNGTEKHKGYLCPKQSLCIEGGNPYNGTVSFDNVLQSLQLVFVIMSSNTFSDLLYYTTDSDFLAGALCRSTTANPGNLLILHSFCLWLCDHEPVAYKFGKVCRLFSK